MWKNILRAIAKALMVFTYNMLFVAIDKNKDGTLSKAEIQEFVELTNDKIAQLRNA